MAEKELSLPLGFDIDTTEVEFYPVPDDREQQQIFQLLQVRDESEQEKLRHANRCFEEAQKCDPPEWFTVQFIERLARSADLSDVIMLEKLIEDYPAMPISVSEEFLFDENGRVLNDGDEYEGEAKLVSQGLPISRIIEDFIGSLYENGINGQDWVVKSAVDADDLPMEASSLMGYWSEVWANSGPPLTARNYEEFAAKIRELKETLDLPKTVIEFIETWDALMMEAEECVENVAEDGLRVIMSNILLGMVLRGVRLSRLKGDMGQPRPIASFDELGDIRWGADVSRNLDFYLDEYDKRAKLIKKRVM